jgi:hypothetical protein
MTPYSARPGVKLSAIQTVEFSNAAHVDLGDVALGE